MGRRKTYDRDALIGKAVHLFRDHGFAGTSTEMLVQGLGINRFSLYNEFGSKQALFDLALERYDADVIESRFGPLEAPTAGLAEIEALLAFYGSAGEGPAAGRGCLLCNTAIELGPHDPSGAGFVQRYFRRLSSAFRNALENAGAAGQLQPSADIPEQAALLTASVLGMFVMIRAKAPPSAIAAAAEAARAHLHALRAPRTGG